MTARSRALTAYLVQTSSWAELPVTLHYRVVEPYAVVVSIGEQHIEWRLGRELLREGIAHPAGEGDVRLWPGHRNPNDQLFLRLSSPSGRALLELPRATVAKFLRETEILVPIGTEATVFSLDAELQALLDGEAS